MQEMLRLREAENGTQIAELLQARASGHQESRFLKMAWFHPKRQKTGRWKERRGGLLGRNTEDW